MINIGIYWNFTADEYDSMLLDIQNEFGYEILEIKECPANHKIKQSDKFCPECGAKVIKKKKEKSKIKDFCPLGFLSEYGFNEDNIDDEEIDEHVIRYSLCSLRGCDLQSLEFDKYFGRMYRDEFIKHEDNVSISKIFSNYFNDADSDRICIYDDGYYNRE